MLYLALGVMLATAAEPTFPVLEQTAPATYPAELVEQGQEATVLLELTLDETGTVIEVVVVESAGEAFDRAAVDAAYAFLFAPALDARGRPVGASLLYRTAFEAVAAPVVAVEGRLRTAGTRVALGDIVLRLTGPGGIRRAVTTGAKGEFTLAGLDAGPWSLVFETAGYDLEIVEFTVAEGKVAEVDIYANSARPWEGTVDATIEVVGRRTAPELTERVLSADEIRYLPGTNGDVVRVIQNLPGVARPPLNIGQLLIRGTAPEDSSYAVDGVGVPIVFHFSGLSTVLAGDLLEEVSFLPGNYGVRYGRTLGGVVDLRTDSSLPTRTSGHASVDVYQATLYAEQPIGDRSALTFAGRRSYIDAVLNPILNGGNSSVQAPRYYDAQVRFQHETDNGFFDAMFFTSDDRFKVVGSADSDPDEVQIALVTSFAKARIRWIEELGQGWRSEASFLIGPDANVFQVAGGEAFEKKFDLSWRHEVTRLATQDRLGWRFGIDFLSRYERFVYDIPAFGQEAERGDTLWISPTPYAEATIKRGPVTVTPGLRVDPFFSGLGYHRLSVDPRLAATVDVGGTTTLKTSAGRYSQFAELRQVMADGGSDSTLSPESSWQVSLGAEQQLGPVLRLEGVAYANRLIGLVVGEEDRFEFFTGPPPVGPFDTDPYANDGKGTIVGVEALLKLETERTVGWIAATASRSSRVKRPGDETKLFAYDQPIVLNALVSHSLPKRWRLGARARYGSGNPFTPVVNRYQLLDQGRFAPVYGESDSERLPAFYQVDIRVDKDWVFDKWTFTAYLDFQNVTGAQNVEVMSWTADYSEPDPITGLPPLPAFGLRGEW